MRTRVKARGFNFTSYSDGGPVFEIVYIYASQFPEAVWTKLSLHVAHKETRDFNEPYLENLPVNRTPNTWPAGSDRETLSREKGAGSARPHRGSTALEVLGVICHPQNEPLISVIQGPCGF